MHDQPEHVGKSLYGLAEKILGREWRVLSLLLKHWPAIVGPKLAEDSAPSTLSFVARPGYGQQAKIHVKIPGALAPAFQMQEETMRARINRLMGYEFVAAIVFEHKVGN